MVFISLNSCGRFVRFRERYADVLVEDAELTIGPGWQSLL